MANLAPQNINEMDEAMASFGDRVADAVAALMGSWRFIIGQTVFVFVWMLLNSWHGWKLMWDSYPYILLNLLFSTQAAYAAPIIMMSQNRQAERDRLQADEDFRVNKHADTEIDKILAIVTELQKRADGQDTMDIQA